MALISATQSGLQRNRPAIDAKSLEVAQFRASCPQTGLEKASHFPSQVSFGHRFSEGPVRSAVLQTPSSECNAITNR
jgi:hypothetical protein